jgi:hypothetical protein
LQSKTGKPVPYALLVALQRPCNVGSPRFTRRVPGRCSFLGLQNVTGPNGASSMINYDAYARPQYTFSPHGAQTTWTYTNSPPTKTGTTNGH